MAAKEKTSATQTAVKKKIQTTAVKPAAAKGTKKKKVQKAPVKKAAVKDSGVTKASAAPEKPVQPKDAADSKAANTAPEKTAAAKDAGEKKIHITADKMIAEGNSNNAEFIGNVKVTQEKTVITADSIKVFYNKDSESKEKAKTEDSIREIIATGNVKIWFDDKIAESSKAVYTADTKILVLTGPASRIISGNNSISGTKITFFRNDGRINVEGGGSKRVEAFFDSEGKTL
jgi:lipopolysaccharide transport protein LptA